MKRLTIAVRNIIFITLSVACNKQDFLDKKPASSIVIPTTLAELRSLLDNTDVFTWSPGLGELSADNYYLTFSNWQATEEKVRNAYVWEKDLYGANRSLDDWKMSYQQVLYSNIVLEQSSKLSPSAAEISEWNNINGSALFLRAFANYNLASHFAQIYDSASTSSDLGIPLRTTADIHSLKQRATIKETYDMIFSDLFTATRLLGDNVLSARNRPTKPACYGLLARICLSIRKYEDARKYADSCLTLYSKLINYNTLATTATTPFDRSNDETIYYSQLTNYDHLNAISTAVFIDTTLYASYAANDLRKAIFFRTITGTNIGMKRGYGGTIYAFGGIAVDEVYLIRAECLARNGNITSAMNDLNNLLSKRWRTGTYSNVTATNISDALNKIQIERRKELVWRGLRWIDLKRYNKEGAGITLKRALNNNTYQLDPNSPLYVFPIPTDETANSSIQQNPR